MFNWMYSQCEMNYGLENKVWKDWKREKEMLVGIKIIAKIDIIPLLSSFFP